MNRKLAVMAATALLAAGGAALFGGVVFAGGTSGNGGGTGRTSIDGDQNCIVPLGSSSGLVGGGLGPVGRCQTYGSGPS